MESNRPIRNGYMAVVISVSTKMQKAYEENGDNKDHTVGEYLDTIGGEDWRAFVDGELKRSNEDNNKTLGGCSQSMSEDNEDNNDNNDAYDVQMEKIMQRFSNFNQILSETSNQDDDDDEEEENENIIGKDL